MSITVGGGRPKSTKPAPARLRPLKSTSAKLMRSLRPSPFRSPPWGLTAPTQAKAQARLSRLGGGLWGRLARGRPTGDRVVGPEEVARVVLRLHLLQPIEGFRRIEQTWVRRDIHKVRVLDIRVPRLKRPRNDLHVRLDSGPDFGVHDHSHGERHNGVVQPWERARMRRGQRERAAE